MALAELIAQKRADADALSLEAKALRDAHPEGFNDSSIAADFTAKVAKLGELKGEIEGLEDELKGRTEFDQINNWMDEPQRVVPFDTDGTKIANGDETGRKALVRRGWELKGDPGSGIWHAPAGNGLVPMWDDDVLFGQLGVRYDGTERPDDERKFLEVTRAAFAPGYRAAFMRSFRLAAKYAKDGEDAPWTRAMMDMTPDERKALSAGSETGGGALVPVDTQAVMIQRIAARAVMLDMVTRVTTSRDKVRWPRVQAHATSGSVYSSGFVGGWVGEMPSWTDTDAAFGTFEIDIFKASARTKLGEDFVNDAEANVLAWIAQNGAENLALVLDEAFIAGSGSGRPTGIIFGGSTVTDISGTTADTISNTAADTGSAPKIIDLVYSLPEQYEPNAQWLMRRSSEGRIRKLVDANGRYLWGASGLNSPSRNEIEGYPLKRSPFLQAEGTNDNVVAVFGDFSAYIAALRTQIAMRVLNERFADADQIGVILSTRAGGALSNEDAVRLGDV